MFDPEKLLGKVLGEVIGGGSRKKGHKGSNSPLGGLTSGSGLMTIIGLGVGAYEILRDKQQGQSPSPMPASPPPPPGQQTGFAAPPPLPGGASFAPAAEIAAPAPIAAGAGGELAIRLIQAMIAATHADGTMDENEEKAVLDKLKGAGLSQEEKMFLLNEMHAPKGVAELTAGITDPATAKTMYMLAASTIAIDSEGERRWLDELAAGLGLSKAVQAFLEEQA